MQHTVYYSTKSNSHPYGQRKVEAQSRDEAQSIVTEQLIAEGFKITAITSV